MCRYAQMLTSVFLWALFFSKMKQVLLLLLCLGASLNLFAQSIQGKVTDENSQPVPFALVSLVGNEAVRTSTDLEGNFSLSETSSSDSLKIESLGFQTLVISVNEASSIQLLASATQLEEVIISVDREKMKRSDAPVAIDIIDEQSIKETKATSLDQVMNQSAGVFMIPLNNEQHMMAVRQPLGMGSKGLFLYLEDGLPIRPNGVFNHNALLEMNQTSISRMEIVRGPSSSIYGSEAVGGAFNFITKRPTKNLSGTASIQANNLGYKRADLDVSKTFGKLGLYAGGYFADRSGGFLEHNDFYKGAFTLRADYSINSKMTWTNVIDYVGYRNDMRGSLDSADFYSGTFGSNQTFTERSVKSLRVRSTLDNYWNDQNKTSFTLYFRNNSIAQIPSYRVQEDFKPWAGTGDPTLAHGSINESSFRSYGGLVQHKKKFKKMNASLIAGLSLDHSPTVFWEDYIRISKTGNEYSSYEHTDSSLANYHTSITNTAFYTQFSFNPIKKVRIVAGGRFDHFFYSYDNHLSEESYSGVPDTSNVFYQFTPRIGIVYNPLKNLGFYSNYSTGFLPPQVGELYRGTKVPSIEPTNYSNIELGGWIGLLKGRIYIDYSLYRLEGTNTIVSMLMDDGSYENRNAGQTRSQGIEYGITVKPNKQFEFRLSGTNASHTYLEFVDGDVDYSDTEMAGSAPFIGNAKLTYRPKFLKNFYASLEWQRVGSYNMSAMPANSTEESKKYEGFHLFNFRAGYEYKQFGIWLNVLNLTNERYAGRASSSQWGESYNIGNPISTNLGLSYSFAKK